MNSALCSEGEASTPKGETACYQRWADEWESGTSPVVALDPGTRGERRLLKVNHLAVCPGTRISARTGGGGGYGPPWEREIEAVLDDVRDGYISRHKAEQDYGLRLAGNGLEVDQAATQVARVKMKQRAEREGERERKGIAKAI